MSISEQLAVRQTGDMLKERRNQFNALYWSHEVLQDMRNQRLKALLTYAKTNSPWYKKRLAKVDIESFTEQHLDEIPAMDKMTLMENWDDIVTDRKLSLSLVEQHIEKMSQDGDTLYLLDRYHVLATSGSSGKRGVFVYDWDEWNEYYLYYRRHRLYNHDRSALLFSPTKKLKIAMVVVSNTVYAMYSMAKTFKIDNVETFHFPITLPLSQIVEGLNQVQADVLQGTPTTIQRLCREAEKGLLTINPTVISMGGEALYKPIRDQIKKTWPDVNVFNTLGSSEGLTGVNCRANSHEMHLNVDACIIQSASGAGGTGNPSSLFYLTNLYNYTLPLIRYEFTDQLLFLDKACECGVSHQLISEPQGRPEYDFTYGNVFVHHLTFVTPLLHEKNIQEYQIIQTEHGADIKLLTIGFLDKNRLKNSICTKLQALGLVNPCINLIEVTQFDYPPSGKLRRFIKIQARV